MASSLQVTDHESAFDNEGKSPSATSVHLYQFICQHKENKLIAHNSFQWEPSDCMQTDGLTWRN